jgi:hypothetical protein
MSKKVGDIVWMDSYTSMGQSALGHYNESKIEKIEYRFDEKTGDKFPIYKVGNDWYDGSGRSYSNDSSMYYIDLDYRPFTEEEKEEIVEKNKKEFEGKKVVTYTPNFEPVYEDEWKERQNRIPIFRNTEIIKNHIEKDGCFMIDYEHRKKAFKVFTVATQHFYVNSLDELTPERFMLEEEKQKQYEKDSSEMFRLSKQNENE